MVCFKIENEDELNRKVINGVRQIKNKNLILCPTLGELQDDDKKRLMAYYRGYMKGIPDLLLINSTKKYKGLCIEFKSPKGTGILTNEQYNMLKEFKNNGWKVIISNNYDKIMRKIYKYVDSVRINCDYCKDKFKTTKTLKNHLKYFHKHTEV
jgi:hypothetical protein